MMLKHYVPEAQAEVIDRLLDELIAIEHGHLRAIGLPEDVGTDYAGRALAMGLEMLKTKAKREYSETQDSRDRRAAAEYRRSHRDER